MPCGSAQQQWYYVVVYLKGYVCAGFSDVLSENWASTGMVANPVCGELNKENEFISVPFPPENLASRNRFGYPFPCQPVYSPYRD